MKRSRSFFATLPIAALGLGVFAGSPAIGAPPAVVGGEVICSADSDGTLLTRVISNGDFTFRLEILDGNLLTAESRQGDYFITLPVLPIDLRYGTAVTTISPGFEVLAGSEAIGQGIQSAPPTGTLPYDYTLTGGLPAAGESVAIAQSPSGELVHWTVDHDIADSPSGGRSLPSNFMFPGQALDASTSVLTFTIRPSAGAPKGVALPAVVGTRTTFNGALLQPDTDVVLPLGETVSQDLPGCIIPAAFLPAAPITTPPTEPPATNPPVIDPQTTEPAVAPTAAPSEAQVGVPELAATGADAVVRSSIGFAMLALGLGALVAMRLRRRMG